MSNPWCEALQIQVPSLAAVKGHREANTYALLLVALLERGAPMSLAEVAARFDQAGVAPASFALASLKRCRPDRPPVYRDGDHYHLDPYSSEFSLWLFRLGLRGRRVARAMPPQPLPKLRWALLYAYPAKNPKAIALLDVDAHAIETFVGAELAALAERVASFDGLGAIEVRTLLRVLNLDAASSRLAELGPPQKTMTIDRRGRTLKITPELVIASCCGISKPFGDTRQLDDYLAAGHDGKLRRRLAASVKSLYALYEYGRTHGAVRVRWGFLDEMLPAPWVHRDEPTLYSLERTALEARAPLEVVIGSAPGWEEPWARAQLAIVCEQPGSYRAELVDERGYRIERRDVQRARLAGVLH